MLRDFKVIRFFLSSVYNTGLYSEMGLKSCNDVCIRGGDKCSVFLHSRVVYTDVSEQLQAGL